MRRMLALLSLTSLALASAPAFALSESLGGDLKGLFRQLATGHCAYESDSYRVEFDREGWMVSLKVNGTEFLRPVRGDAGGAGFFHDGHRVLLPSMRDPALNGGLFGDGCYGIFLHMEPDRLDIDIGQEAPTGRVEYVFFPAEGITMAPVENPAFRGWRPEPWQIISKTATRWTAPDGTAIELHYDTQLQQSYNGFPAMPVNDPFRTRICGEIRFPKSAWGNAKAAINWEADLEDHSYPKGKPITITGTVALGGNAGEKPVDLVVRLADFNTLAPAHEESGKLTCADAKPTAFQQTLRWNRPGPWRLSVLAVDGDHAIGLKSGVIVYDLPNYRPPLNRPEDFWQFWGKAIATQRALPLDPVLLKREADSTAEYVVYDVYITGYMGRRIKGSYREPVAPGRYPATFGGSDEKDRTCTVSMTLDGMATYRTGMGNRHTSNFFYNYVDALRWVDFLASREKADLNRSIYYGGSRTGPIGIAVLALDPRLKMYIVNVPTNNRWDWQVTYPGAGAWGPWPNDRLPGQSLDAFTRELSYFNPDNFAERVTQPALIGLGLMDGLSQVTGNLACYARLASAEKKICLRAWAGHGDANQDWYATAAKWRKELFAQPSSPPTP